VNPFITLRDYETFVYTLRQQYSSIQSARLVIVPHGKQIAVLSGELRFAHSYRITVRERISWETGIGVIDAYSYNLWHNADKIAWYDPQPHPHITALAGTHPHHKHVPPDIKHNRIPAPEMSFTQPNLPALIKETELLIAQAGAN